MADPTPLDLSGADGPDYSKLPPPPGPGDYDGGKSAGEGQDGKDDGKKCGTHSSEGSPGHQGLQGNSGQKGGTGNHGGDFTFKATNMTGNWPVNTSGGKGGGGQTGGEGGTGQAGGAGGKGSKNCKGSDGGPGGSGGIGGTGWFSYWSRSRKGSVRTVCS